MSDVVLYIEELSAEILDGIYSAVTGSNFCSYLIEKVAKSIMCLCT